MPYQSVGDFPVDVMMNQFNFSDWNHNDDSDLYESIDLNKSYYDIDIMIVRNWDKLPVSII